MLVGENIREDYIQRFCAENKDGVRFLTVAVFLAAIKDRGFRAVVLYRIGRCLRVRGHNILAGFIEKLIHRLCFCEISTTANIGPGFRVFHPFGLVVGTDVRAGKNLTLSMDVVLGGNVNKCRQDGSEKPILGDNINIAAGSKVVGPISVGNNCLVGANSVVVSDMPSDSVVAGVPGRVIRRQEKKVSLLEQNGELSEILRDVVRRIQEIEKEINNN